MEKKLSENKNGLPLLLYFALKPLYLWNSGMLQLADLILVFFLALCLFKSKGTFTLYNERSDGIIKYVFVLISYQFIINFIWYIFIQEFSVIKSSMYYIFNAMAFAFTILTVQDCGIDRVKKAIAKGAVYSTMITIIGMIMYTGTSRATGFFNNPNQLGYYAIIILTILLYLRSYLSKIERIIILIGGVVATFESLSKAAIISSFILISIYSIIYQEKKTVFSIIKKLSIIAIIGLLIYWLLYSDSELVYNNRTLYLTRYRLIHMMEENDSSLGEGRGYDRVKELGVHFLWGMGEGAYSRFTVKHNSEVHSTFISILVSYGLIGFFGYIRFFAKCIRKQEQTIRNVALLSGVFFYSLSHNGIRSTLLWLLLAVMFMDDRSVIRQIEQPTQADNQVSDF